MLLAEEYGNLTDLEKFGLKLENKFFHKPAEEIHSLKDFLF